MSASKIELKDGHLGYPHVYPLPKYSAAIYGGSLERDKIYETQVYKALGL